MQEESAPRSEPGSPNLGWAGGSHGHDLVRAGAESGGPTRAVCVLDLVFKANLVIHDNCTRLNFYITRSFKL